jgi:hypothetical protein
MEAGGEGDWNFNQIKGNTNAEPDDNYKAMIREWFGTIDDDTLSYGSEENEALDDLANGHYDQRDHSVSEMVQRALDWYEEENDYGIPNNRQGEKPDFEDIYDAAIKGKSGGYGNPHPQSFSDVGEVLVSQALDWDMKRFDNELSYETLMERGARSRAQSERLENFHELKERPGRGSGRSEKYWAQSDEQKKEYADYMRNFFKSVGEEATNLDSWGYVSSAENSRHDEIRGQQLLQQAQSDPELLADLQSRAAEAFAQQSYFEQVMQLREEKEQEFYENFTMYYEGGGYPDEDDYEDPAEYASAVEAYEDEESMSMDYARDENIDAYIAKDMYDTAVKMFTNYDIDVPEWLLNVKKRSGAGLNIAWMANMKNQNEKAASSESLYKEADVSMARHIAARASLRNRIFAGKEDPQCLLKELMDKISDGDGLEVFFMDDDPTSIFLSFGDWAEVPEEKVIEFEDNGYSVVEWDYEVGSPGEGWTRVKGTRLKDNFSKGSSMNWYKKAQQETWWNKFYHHMTNTAEFILQDSGIQIDAHKNSINDGQRANFMMKASYSGKPYTIRVQLEFTDRLNNLEFGPMGTGRLEGIPNAELMRANVTVISGSNIVDQRQFNPGQADPASLMTAAKDMILNDPGLEKNAPYSDYDPSERDYQ